MTNMFVPRRRSRAALRSGLAVALQIDGPIGCTPTPSIWPCRSGLVMRWQAVGEDEDLWMHDITPTWERIRGVLYAKLEIDRRGRVVQ